MLGVDDTSEEDEEDDRKKKKRRRRRDIESESENEENEAVTLGFDEEAVSHEFHEGNKDDDDDDSEEVDDDDREDEDEDEDEDEEDDDDDDDDDDVFEDLSNDLSALDDMNDFSSISRSVVDPTCSIPSASKHPQLPTSLPYTFPCPQTYEELTNILHGVELKDVPTVVHRICVLHHLKLDPGNKEKLEASELHCW